jgi:hypothetical protein
LDYASYYRKLKTSNYKQPAPCHFISNRWTDSRSHVSSRDAIRILLSNNEQQFLSLQNSNRWADSRFLVTFPEAIQHRINTIWLKVGQLNLSFQFLYICICLVTIKSLDYASYYRKLQTFNYKQPARCHFISNRWTDSRSHVSSRDAIRILLSNNKQQFLSLQNSNRWADSRFLVTFPEANTYRINTIWLKFGQLNLSFQFLYLFIY